MRVYFGIFKDYSSVSKVGNVVILFSFSEPVVTKKTQKSESSVKAEIILLFSREQDTCRGQGTLRSTQQSRSGNSVVSINLY